MSKPNVKVFNYGAYSARDYWNLIAKSDLEDFKKQRNPRSVAHVVQSLWGLLEWYAQEQGKKPQSYYPSCPKLAWIKDIANSAKHRGLDKPREAVKHMGHLNIGTPAYSVPGSGGYASSEPFVVLDDDSEHKLIDFIPTIEEFWQKQFV